MKSTEMGGVDTSVPGLYDLGAKDSTIRPSKHPTQQSRIGPKVEQPDLNTVFAPKPNDTDLVTAVEAALVEAGFSPEHVAAFKSNELVVAAVGQNSHVQINRLNHWLNGQYLACSGHNTSQERSLIPQVPDASVWLHAFKTYHIQKLKALGLPFSW